jgi:hypothetical protein
MDSRYGLGRGKARLIGVVAACIFKVLVAMEEVK